MKIEKTKAQMKKGVLELCTLGIIDQRDAYTSDIINALKKSELIVVEGTLYTLLNRLKNEGYLDYYWQESDQGPPRKYYTITGMGKEFLGQLKEAWNELASGINNTLKNINS